MNRHSIIIIGRIITSLWWSCGAGFGIRDYNILIGRYWALVTKLAVCRSLWYFLHDG